LYYDRYPFIPRLYENSTYPYRLLVFYRDESQIASRIIYESYNAYYANQAVLPGAVVMRYHPCYSSNLADRFNRLSSVILLPTREVSPSDCSGGPNNDALNPLQLEDNHLQLALASRTTETSFNPSDFLIVAFYDHYPWNFGAREFELVAFDKQKYYFENDPPPHQRPQTPQNLRLTSYTIDAPTSTVTLNWQKATDPDTLDDLLFYEFSLDGGLSWQTLVPRNEDRGQLSLLLGQTYLSLPLGQTYEFLMRAVDDFGNVSDSTSTTFTLPAPVRDTTPRSNNWFAVDSARVEDGVLKVRWRLLGKPPEAESVFSIFPFVSTIGSYNIWDPPLHKNFSAPWPYPYLTANSYFRCSDRITSFAEY